MPSTSQANNNDLSRDAVKGLLTPVEDPQVIEQLYAFGSMLLAEIKERIAEIEKKAGALLGWSVGITVFLYTQFEKIKSWIGLASVVSAAIAVICAYVAMKSRDDWRSPSDKDWMKDSCLNNADDLKHYHVRSMHEIKTNLNTIARNKGEWLLRAEISLIVSAVLLTIALTVRSLVSLYRGGLPFF